MRKSNSNPANDVTTIYYLEMLDPQELRPKESPRGFAVSLVDPPDKECNRSYYEAVGKQWQWTDRLTWSDDAWTRYVYRESLKTWIGRLDGEPAGYFELESQADSNVELAYFGLLPDFIGRGLGGALLTAAVRRAWSISGTRRVWVHTCTKDHPYALDNYRKRGFKVYKAEQAS